MRASKVLRLAQPTVSTQIHRLEDMLGVKLFEKRGRRLELTQRGRIVQKYATQIFGIGEELVRVARSEEPRPSERFVVGVADVLPKSMVRMVLDPVLGRDAPVHLVVREDRAIDEFLAELALHTVDVVLSDSPPPPGPVRVFSHLLGESGTTFFISKKLARQYSVKKGGRSKATLRWPSCLTNIPLMMPGVKSNFRRALEQWAQTKNIRLNVIAEIDDTALSKLLGESGVGMFAGPSVIEQEVLKRYAVQVVGRESAVRNQLFALTTERAFSHPVTLAIVRAAHMSLFKSASGVKSKNVGKKGQ